MNPSDHPTPTPPIDDPRTFARRMEALADLAAALTAVDDESRLSELASEHLDGLIPVARASIGVVTDEGRLQVRGLHGRGFTRPGEMIEVEGTALQTVIESGRFLYHPDVTRSDLADFQRMAQLGYGSAIVVPLTAGGATIGTFNLAREGTDGFSTDDIRLLDHAGRLLAVAMLSVRRLTAARSAERASALAHELAAQRVRDIETLNRVFRILDDGIGLDQRLVGVARELSTLRGIDRCLLALTGDDGQLRLVGPWPDRPDRRLGDLSQPPDPAGTEQPMAVATLRRAVNEGRPIWDGRTEPDGSWQARHLAVPIVVRGRAAGAVGLTSRGSETIRAGQGMLAETVASQIANAVERDLMFDELKRAAATADAASRSRSQFLANMSHELRTPMNGVIGMISLLEETELTPQQRMYVETIRMSGEAQVAVINHILDFSKIEADRLELQVAPFDLRVCVEDALDLAAATLGAKPVELSYEIDPTLPARYLGDAVRLRQVLINLLNNAAKFTERGEVTVRVDTTDAGLLRVAVSDTGPGIPPDRIEWLFEPFTQMAAAPGQGQGGSGLGLAICRQLVDLMGGTIGATSEPGAGSTFEVVLPLAAEPGQTPTGTEPDLAGRSVLVAGLGPASRAMLARTLESWGMTVETRADLPPARVPDPAPGPSFDIALVDCRLQASVAGAAGWQQLAGSLGAPVITLNASGAPPLGADAAGGSETLMARPVKPAMLRAALLATIGRQPGAGPDPGAGPGAAAEVRPRTGARPDRRDEPPLGTVHPLQVLVAEDNRVNQKVAVALLERLGYRADVAADGLEAVAAATIGPGYDLILMDLKMPGLDGIDAAREIRRLLPRHPPRIVAMTADTIAVVRASCLDAGMAGFITKPVRLDDLAEVLRNTPPSGPAGSVIDEAALAALAEVVDHDQSAIDDIIAVWIADTPALVRDVQTAYDQSDLERLIEAAHPLVSSSATVGALTLSGQAAAIERRAREGRLPDPVTLANLRVTANQAITALDRRLGPQPSPA